MVSESNKSQMNIIYQHAWSAHGDGPFAVLDESLNPRSPNMLFDVVEEVGIGADDIVLDVGCGRGNHACELAQRFSCNVVGLDPVANNLKEARNRAMEANVMDWVTFRQGGIESLPFDEGTFDLIWCRDVLVHIPELEQSLKECTRVLKPKATMVVFTTLATNLMGLDEASRLCEPMGVVVENFSQDHIENAFEAAGLDILLSQEIGSEWIEHLEERDGRYSKELMRIARMRRTKDKFIDDLGSDVYEVSLALYHWGIYILLGKLSPIIYVLTNH